MALDDDEDPEDWYPSTIIMVAGSGHPETDVPAPDPGPSRYENLL